MKQEMPGWQHQHLHHMQIVCTSLQTDNYASTSSLSFFTGRMMCMIIHRVSEETVQIYFCQNFVKFSPILVIFGRKMAMGLKLREVYSFSTSPNSRHHTTVLNADVPNCYTALKVVMFDKLSSDLISTQ